ncbi:hypothetical protein AVEN_130037-1 [Araneus ventricosus]|uniref:Transposase Tc1-like domain-containing protein n=1 Tax=Araneus ventricosus TaxID=182803 RepID=A0A4Y2UD74_ARAVE|nr:hypothetical protein AVEN_130037-1 [Araneus ventricosus]
MAVAHRPVPAAEIPTCFGIRVTQQTVTNRLLEGKLRARRPTAFMPLTPNHRTQRLYWCQTRVHWRTERWYVVFSDERKIVASDDHMLQEHSRRYLTHLGNKFVRHTGDLTGCDVIFMTIPMDLFQQDNARPHTDAVTQRSLLSVDVLPWLARSPDLSPIQHVWDIIGLQR